MCKTYADWCSITRCVEILFLHKKSQSKNSPRQIWFRRQLRSSFYFVLRSRLHFGYLCRIRDGVVMKKSVDRYTHRYSYVWQGVSVRVPSCFVDTWYWYIRRSEGGYIGVSRGSVLPFYPNVISAKYENSYVLRYIRIVGVIVVSAGDTFDTLDEVSARESQAWAVLTGKHDT